jgi:cytochrome c oxidase subunit 2
MKNKVIIILVLLFIILSIVLLINIQNLQKTEIKNAEIIMIAKQWRFEIINAIGILKYEYIPMGETRANLTIYLSKNTMVTIKIKSIDVVHGIGIEGFQVMATLPPNEEVEIKFFANKEGKFKFYCTVFCGTGHPEHLGYFVII